MSIGATTKPHGRRLSSQHHHEQTRLIQHRCTSMA
jgi:hypothetical protein